MTDNRPLNQNEMLVMYAIMRRRSDAYGVTIRDEIENRTSRRMTFGVLYSILTRLENEGMLKSKTGEATPERGGRAKTFFTITAKGQQSMNATAADFDAMRRGLPIGGVLAHG